jgi:hypothetical protein
LSGSYELGDNIWVDRKQVEVITWQNGEVFWKNMKRMFGIQEKLIR